MENYGEFLTPNGRKFVLKQIEQLNNHLEKVLAIKGDSTKEIQETEISHRDDIKTLQQQIIKCQKLLSLPLKSVKEQNIECLHGNGVKIKMNGNPLYVVIDGVCVCKHSLPENHAIIGANSPLGRVLIGKKVGDTGTFLTKEGEKKFTVEKIHLPSSAKWVFKYDNPIRELEK